MDTEERWALLTTEQWQQLADIAARLAKSAPCGGGYEVDGAALYLHCTPEIDHSTAPLGYSIKGVNIKMTVTPNP
jgi:hypothetical protein